MLGGVQGITEYSVFTHPDGDEHARVRRHMMKFFNAENVALTISELAGECLRTADIIADAAAGAPAYACNPDNRRVLISEGGARHSVSLRVPDEAALDVMHANISVCPRLFEARAAIADDPRERPRKNAYRVWGRCVGGRVSVAHIYLMAPWNSEVPPSRHLPF